MQFFYDGAIRKYLIQTMRVFSNFSVKYSDGTLMRVPVVYGDPDRQVSSIIRQNSENTVIACPKIAVYISQMSLDRDRLADATFVGKLHIRERGIAVDPVTGLEIYTQDQGRNYTVERLMPTPYRLVMKVDVWASSTEQKLQILEQILVLFNPSLELQTNDNYVDWSSLSVLNLDDVNWSSRSIPVGNDSPIDIATLTVSAPAWISPPAKVKHLGIVTKIITSIYQDADTTWSNLDSLGADLSGGTTSFSNMLSREIVTITDYNIRVSSGKMFLMPATTPVSSSVAVDSTTSETGDFISWDYVLTQYPGQYIAGVSKVFLPKLDGSEVTGTFSVDSVDSTTAYVRWDTDTYPKDDAIVTNGARESNGQRSAGTFDAIIDPFITYPGHGISNLVNGDRFLLVNSIGSSINNDGPDAWKNSDQTDFIANENDIIEWQGTSWEVIFDSKASSDNSLYQTNIYNGNRVQYYWNGVYWAKSFDGDYAASKWRIEL